MSERGEGGGSVPGLASAAAWRLAFTGTVSHTSSASVASCTCSTAQNNAECQDQVDFASLAGFTSRLALGLHGHRLPHILGVCRLLQTIRV